MDKQILQAAHQKRQTLTPEEETTKHTYDKLAQSWIANHKTKSFWYEELQIFHTLLPTGRILEVGSGGGRDAKELTELGYEYVGTDISSGLLHEAQKLNPHATFKEVSLYDLNFAKPFDGFWCAAVLLHIPKNRINNALLSIQRNLKKGSIGFIAIKEGHGERMQQKDDQLDDRRFFSYWQNDEFKEVLQANGFRIMHESSRSVNEHTTWLTYHVGI